MIRVYLWLTSISQEKLTEIDGSPHYNLKDFYGGSSLALSSGLYLFFWAALQRKCINQKLSVRANERLILRENSRWKYIYEAIKGAPLLQQPKHNDRSEAVRRLIARRVITGKQVLAGHVHSLQKRLLHKMHKQRWETYFCLAQIAKKDNSFNDFKKPTLTK